jgi:hypothetical protein
MDRMRELLSLAKIIEVQRPGNQHPVSTLYSRAKGEGIHGLDFDEALSSAVAAGFLILTPDCGPKQMGVFVLKPDSENDDE